MMATTHAFVGAALATVTAFVAPEAAPAAVLAGFLGGLAPDLDLLFAHRRTLHFPFVGPFVATGTLAVVFLLPSAATITLAAFVAAAALHPVMDAAGGSRELRPWDRTTDRAVYDHVRGRWLSARRLVRYDGAPEDLALGAVAGLPVLAVTEGTLETLVVAAVGLSLAYTLARKRIPDVYATLVDRLHGPAGTSRPSPDGHGPGEQN